MKKLLNPTRNAKLRCLSVWVALMLSIGFIVYNFGATSSDSKALATNKSMSVSIQSVSTNSFWSDPSVNLETNIPDDVLTQVDKILIVEKTVLVDVSIKLFTIFVS